MDLVDTVDYFWETRGETKTFVKQSNIADAGLGAFAAINFDDGEIIGVYEGKKYTQNKIFSGSTMKYVFEYDLYGYKFQIVPSLSCNMRYINDIIHVGKSRFYGQRINQRGIDYNVEWLQYDETVYIRAKREIQMGEELYIDYGDNYWKSYWQKPLSELVCN